MAKTRTHKAQVEKERGNLSQEQIRANKCERSKQRNLARKVEQTKQALERLAAWRKFTAAQKLAELDKRPGNSARQRARILGETK